MDRVGYNERMMGSRVRTGGGLFFHQSALNISRGTLWVVVDRRQCNHSPCAADEGLESVFHTFQAPTVGTRVPRRSMYHAFRGEFTDMLGLSLVEESVRGSRARTAPAVPPYSIQPDNPTIHHQERQPNATPPPPPTSNLTPTQPNNQRPHQH